VQLVLWVGGHNQLVHFGTQFLVLGSGDAASAYASEQFARLIKVPLDDGPMDDPVYRRHQGTVASWANATGADYRTMYHTAEVGARPFEWAKLVYPGLCANLCAQSCETPMLRPIRRGPWSGRLTLGRAQAIAAEQTVPVQRLLEPLIDLSNMLS